MSTYLVRFWNGYKYQSTKIEAKNYREVRKLAFRWMSERSGDWLSSVEIYEQKSFIDCDGELNPRNRARAMRDLDGRIKGGL